MKNCKNTCNSCKYLARCGACSLCEAMICNSNCNTCCSVCTNKKNIIKYLDSFGNFNIKLKKNDYLRLPIHIPVIPFRLNMFIDVEYIALHAGSLLSNNGEKIVKRYLEKGYPAALNLKPGTKALLEFYVKDKFLEGFWDKRYSIYKNLKTMNFTYIISPNYSVYDDSPRIDHLYNIKRNSIVYNELLDIGINAVPDISWFNLKDLEYWLNEINKHNIKIIAFSFQNVGVGLKASNHWKQSLLGFRYLCSNIKSDVDIIIAGIASPFRISEIYQTIKKTTRLIILNQSAYIQSRKGILSEIRESAPELEFDDLLVKNIKYFDKIYEEIYKSDKLLKLSQLPKERLLQIYKNLKLNPDSKDNNYISNFLFRCLKKRHVSEVILSQNQEETQFQNNLQIRHPHQDQI